MEPEDATAAWHREVITDEAAATLIRLRGVAALEAFYLAGGTGLALALGHRRSVDLDFFTSHAFESEPLLRRIEAVPDFALAARDPETIHASVGGVKVSFLGYRYPLLFPSRPFMGVAVADPREIACMKISAIASRGTKRDFVDLYFVAQTHGLRALFQYFAAKYAQTNYSPLHIAKALTFFEDAEKDPMPDMLAVCDWAEVKQYFSHEAPRLL